MEVILKSISKKNQNFTIFQVTFFYLYSKLINFFRWLFFILTKYELNDQTETNRPFSKYFRFKPIPFYLIINLIAILGIFCIGFLFLNVFNANSYKSIGDHCDSQSDCEPNMNYECTNHICSCALGTYFVQSGSPCG